MNPIFKNVTKYNKNNYQQFTEFHNKKYGFSHNAYTLIMSILLIYCVIFNIIEKNLEFALLFLALLIVFLLYRIYLPTRRYKKTQKKYTANKEENFVFCFYKYYFTINNKTFYYFKLYKVFETNDFFYLYIDDENAALLNKSGFQVGSSNDFSNFIKKKCLFKYNKQT